MTEAKPLASLTREQRNLDDIKLLFEDPKFRRFLFTLRLLSGTEQPAISPEERSIHYMEGRRHFWCDVLFQVNQAVGPEALLRILEAELDTQKGTSNGRKPYQRLDIDDGDRPGARGRARTGSGADAPAVLDYGTAALVE